jgi:hypothetical protein
VNYDFSSKSSFCLPSGKADDITSSAFLESSAGQACVAWPAVAQRAKAAQGFGIAYYSLTLDALNLGHPRLSLNKGVSSQCVSFRDFRKG